MKDRIKRVMLKTFEVEIIPDDISKHNFQVWDSLKHLLLISNLEIEFNISFEPEEIFKIQNIRNIEDILKKNNVISRYNDI